MLKINLMSKITPLIARITHKVNEIKHWFTPQELSPEEHATWVSAGQPSLLFYTSQDRRVEDKGRGPVPWDEPYERRNYPHNY
jgi:hypothetical protein|tara:strand:- start:477 stop:725 length:249 start_codon:yes stop_codon:yes gene_type:complete